MNHYSFSQHTLGEIIINHDNKRIPLSGKERALRKGCYPYYGAQGIIDYINDFNVVAADIIGEISYLSNNQT